MMLLLNVLFPIRRTAIQALLRLLAPFHAAVVPLPLNLVRNSLRLSPNAARHIEWRLLEHREGVGPR